MGVRGRPGTGWIVIKVPTPITTAVTRARTACNPMERSRASRGSGNEANTPAAIYDPGGGNVGRGATTTLVGVSHEFIEAYSMNRVE